MRPWLAIRWSFAWVVLIAGVLIVAVLAGNATAQPSYGPAVAGSAQGAVRFLAPLAATVAAFLIHPVSAYLDERPPVRHRAAGLLVLIWPVLAAVLLAHLIGLLITAARSGELMALVDARALAMNGVDVLVLAAWTMIGVLAGTLLPRLLAPLVGVVSYLWMAWLPALGVPWLRHVTGQQYGCCAADSEPVPALMMLGAATALGLLGTALMALAPRRRWLRALTGCGLGIAVAVAWAIASQLPTRDAFVMSEPRDDPVFCASGEHTVCVWPEDADQAARLQTLLDDASARLEASGLGHDLPASLSERPATGGALLDYTGQNDHQILLNAAYADLITQHPDLTSCTPHGRHYDTPSVAAQIVAAHAGADLTQVSVDSASRAEAGALLAMDISRQRAFLDGLSAACGP